MGMRRSQAEAVESERDGQADSTGQDAVEPSAPGRRGFAAAYRDFTEEFDLATLALDPGELFGGIREDVGGCDVRL